MGSRKRKILNVLPHSRDCTILENCGLSGEEYEFHEIPVGTNEKYLPIPARDLDYIDANLCSYVDKAVAYIKQHGISHVLFATDLGSIVGAAICERSGLPGPTVESQFLCLHKYYTRKAEPSKLRFDYIDLNDGDAWKDKVWYPCYIKAPFLHSTICHFVIHNEAEMEDALQSSRRWLRTWFDLVKPFLQRYVDLEKYPLATSEVLIIEEFVRDFDAMLCVEGWVTADRHYHIFATKEYTYYSEPVSFNNTTFPSHIQPHVRTAVEEYALQVVQKFDLSNQFFNVELWKRGSQLDVTEVNARISPNCETLYKLGYGVSLYKASVHVACGELDKALNESPGNEKCIAGDFTINVRGEGNLGDMIDYQKVKSLGETEEVYDVFGKRGISIFAPENFVIGKEARFMVGSFYVSALSRELVLKKADVILSQLYKHPDYRPRL